MYRTVHTGQIPIKKRKRKEKFAPDTFAADDDDAYRLLLIQDKEKEMCIYIHKGERKQIHPASGRKEKRCKEIGREDRLLHLETPVLTTCSMIY